MNRYLTGVVRVDKGSTVGRCSNCGIEFESGAPDGATAEGELQMMFEAHRCRNQSEDVNQAATRIVREATRNS